MRIFWNTFPKKYTRPAPHQFPTGTRVYTGFQGSGKTLSMVKYAFDIQNEFPDCEIYSNVKIKGLAKYHYIGNDQVLSQALISTNGCAGVLIMLDEAHLFFNKKDGISLDVLTAISQQRKDRKRLVFTSQIWNELDVSLRKQVKEIVSCKCFFKHFQVNTISDGETLHFNKLTSDYEANKIRTEIFKHYNELYESYDTYQKIYNNNEYNRTPTSTNIIFGDFSTPEKHSLFNRKTKKR